MSVSPETDLKMPLKSLCNPDFVKDMLLTLLAAVMTGVSGSMLLIILVFSWGSAQAESAERYGAQLQLRSLNGQSIEMAPLLNTEVSIEVSGMLAWIKVEQVFTNPTRSWMEGSYQFPLPEGSAVERMKMEIGDRQIEGVIEEKAAAKRIFKKARAEGKKASLLTQQRPNIFTLAATNIAPGETVRINIEYQQRVHYSGKRFELRFPMVVAPRYLPKSLQATEDNQISPPYIAQRAGLINPLSMEIDIDAGVPLAEVISHHHKMVEQRDGQGVVRLKLADGEVEADRDLVISWRPEVGAEPELALFREHWQEEDYALLMLMPPDASKPDEILSRELIFVIDHSGSMKGASILQAKAALRMAVRRLKVRDRFNLIAFNSRSETLFSSPQSATRNNQKRALDFIDQLRANGGTEMMPALELALKQSEDANLLRQVVFLTDGSLGNEQELFALIQHSLGQSRLFTVGIGSAPNSHFMQRAADFGRGSFSYIGDQSGVTLTMQTLFEKLEYPSMRNIQLEWRGKGQIEVEPQRLPDLYLGEPLQLALKGDDLEGRLIVTGDRDGKPWTRDIEISRGQNHRTGVHSLWARERIKTVMASTATTTQEERREQVLQLAMDHKLISAYTSLVAVEKRPVRPLDEDLQGGVIPVSLPAGWSPKAVFGRLPQTATTGPLYLLSGVLLILLAWLVYGIGSKMSGKQKPGFCN
ncbi:MAG: marine proteobacterial sortase target protein [Candidatus Thiodiazotropha sp. 6PDIVS]